MKKILDFLASFVVPKKMLKHKDMNIFVILIIMLLSFFACTFISNLRTRTFVERNPESLYYYEDMTNIIEEKDELAKLPVFELEDGRVKNAELVMETVKNPYTFTYKENEDDLPLEVELYFFLDKVTFTADAIKEGTEKIDPKELNLHEKLVNPYDDDLNKKSNNLLVVYTNSSVFYIYNNGYVLSRGTVINYLDNIWTMYEKDEEGNQIYFLPKDATEVENNHWTVVANVGDTAEIPGYGLYEARKQVTQNIFDIFYNYDKGSKRVGFYEYGVSEEAGINLYKFSKDTKWSEVLNNLAEVTIQSSVGDFKFKTTLKGLLHILALPFGWSFLLWLLTKKFGQLKYYKEYLAIAATSMVLPCIVISITSCFIPYFNIARWGTALIAAFYFLTIIGINGTRKQQNSDDDSENKNINNRQQKINYDIETKKVAQMD